jgi:hypothetical protein
MIANGRHSTDPAFARHAHEIWGFGGLCFGNTRLIGRYRGKGTPRRKVKKVHRAAGTDDKKLQAALKKLNVQPIQAIEEVNMQRHPLLGTQGCVHPSSSHMTALEGLCQTSHV